MIDEPPATDPPTAILDSKTNYPYYVDGTEVKYICECGNERFHVYYEAGCYRTFVECDACRHLEDVHTG
jgi:hypothetical protein